MTSAERCHIARVIALGCIVCGCSAVPHHPRELSLGCGTGLKASNFDVIGLCNSHHTTGGYGVAIHAGVEEWERRYGTQIELLAQVRAELGMT